MPDGREPILPEDPDLLAGGKVEWEVIRRRKDGTRFYAHITGKRVQLSDDEDAAYLIFRDISARKEAEALFTGEKRLLEVIAAGGPLMSTLDALCRLAEDIDGSSLVSILLLDRNGKFHPGAGPSLPPSYLDALDGWPFGLGIGPCATAAHLGEQVISLDLAADQRWAPAYRALASAHGLHACWSTPIKSSQGRPLGTFAIYPREPNSPTPEQQSRIEQLTHLASIAIERAQSMDALRRSEERYALAMEAAADGHMDWNLVTGEFYISPRMLKMIGHAPDATFIDHDDWVRRFPFHPEDRPRWETAIADHFAGREAKFGGDFRIVVSGETRWLAFNFIATRDATGNVVRWTGSVADINDAKRDIATVLDAIPGLVAILTPVGEVDAVNSELIAYCGQPLEAMRRWGTNGTVHLEDLPRVAVVFMQAISRGEPYDFEARIRRFDGVYRWNQVRGLPFRDASGRIIRWYVLLSDIDASKRAEEALRLSEERYALAMQAAAEGHFDSDLETGQMFVSERLNEIYDFPRHATIVNRAEFLKQIPLHPDDRYLLDDIITGDRVRPEWQKPNQDLFEYDCRIIPRPGEIRWLHIRGKVIRDAKGRARRRVGVAADITDRKVAEEALRLSEERYALAMEASEEGHFDWNVATDEIFASKHLQQVLDLPADAEHRTRGELMAALIPFHPDDRERVKEMTRDVLGSAALHHEFEYRLLRGQAQELRWIHSRWKIFRDTLGVAQRVIGVVSDITERKRVEEALREQTERLQLGQAAMRMIIMDWNVTEDQLTWSDSPEWLRGPMPASGHYPLFKDQVHPEDRDSFLATRRRALETLQVQTTEFRLVRTDGEVTWVLERKHAFAGADGKPVRMLSAMFDITERKRAEDELRESEARFRALTALWSDWYWRQDEHLRFTYSTAALDPPDGYPGGSAIGKTRWELSGIVPLSCSWAEHREQLAAHRPFREFEYSRPAADGTIRYVSTSGIPIFDEKGGFRGYHGVARNITERKRVEEELRSRQEMLEVAQKAARAAAFEWRVGAGEGKSRWTPDLEAMHEIPAGSYDGTYEAWKKLVHPDDWPNVQAAIKAAQQTGDVDAEYRVVHPGDAVRWLQAIGRMLFDPEGRPTRLVGFMLDVTDRHRAEEELQQLERQLRQAQRLEALGTLAGGIAHDFNNLLGAILGYGEMALRNARAGSRLRRDIESIMIAGERGHALVERILAFSRSGVGERVAVHVEKVVRETLALFAAKLPRHIAIERRLNAGSAAVMGDPTQIHQVLMNLLTNAVQAMPSTGTLRVSLDRIHFQAPRVVTTGTIAAREYVMLEVSDSGSGIPAEILEKIFDPFFSTKEVGVGTGLGLSLVHGIVTGLGSAIDVATTFGKGSVFTVYLPLAGEVTVPSTPRKRPEPRTRRARRGHVLVIDDEDALVKLATETLTASGYSAAGFASSAKALEAFLAHPEQFDAVITDESMPGMSGSELICKMRALRPTLPILLMSGYLSAAVIESAREAGATEVLKKPLSARQLESAVQRALLPTSTPGKKDRVSSSKSSAEPRRRLGASRSQSGPTRR